MTKGIYKIQNIFNDKCYFGSSLNIKQRFIDHRKNLRRGTHHSGHLQNSWNKYGENNFVFEIIEVVVDENQLVKKEQKHINKNKSYDRKFGYNINPLATSCLGVKRSERTRARIRENHADISGKNNPMYGRKHSKKTKKILSEKKKEMYASGVKPYRLGKTFSCFKFYYNDVFVAEIRGQKQALIFCKKNKLPFQSLCKGKSLWKEWYCERNKKLS